MPAGFVRSCLRRRKAADSLCCRDYHRPEARRRRPIDRFAGRRSQFFKVRYASHGIRRTDAGPAPTVRPADSSSGMWNFRHPAASVAARTERFLGESDSAFVRFVTLPGVKEADLQQYPSQRPSGRYWPRGKRPPPSPWTEANFNSFCPEFQNRDRN